MHQVICKTRGLLTALYVAKCPPAATTETAACALQMNPAGSTGPARYVSSQYSRGEACDLVNGHRSAEVRDLTPAPQLVLVPAGYAFDLLPSARSSLGPQQAFMRDCWIEEDPP